MQSLPQSSRVHQGLSCRGCRRVSPGVYFHCDHGADRDCDLIGEGEGHGSDRDCDLIDEGQGHDTS